MGAEHSPGAVEPALGPPGTARVRALRPCRVEGIPRRPGQEFFCEITTALHLSKYKFVERLLEGVPGAPLEWRPLHGRELRAFPPEPPVARLVACLNIWNDQPALEETLPSWLPFVDAVHIADGQYGGGPSEDGLSEYLEGLRAAAPAVVFHVKHQPGASQQAKRQALLQSGQPGDVLFIVDADEYCEGAEKLRRLPALDVGWVDILSPIYARPYGQPRLIRWRPDLAYRGRHHWLWAGAELLATHQYGGLALHALSGIRLHNCRGLRHSAERAQAKREGLSAQSQAEAAAVALPGRSEASDGSRRARESLRILQLTHYDPGLVAYRLHTAINCTTPHASLLASSSVNNPFGALQQFDPAADALPLRQALRSADIIHCHLDYGVLKGLGGEALALPPLVIHHHGSILRKMAGFFAMRDKELGALRLISNLELTKYGEGLHWLPNPVPCAEYRQLFARRWAPHEEYRVAHSPSKRHLKGTEEFLAACASLRAAGLNIEPVLIEGLKHREALELKASCDACFDSFWLGIQCSGVEAAAMGLPVIAGDPYVAAQYQARLGFVPYTFANTAEELERALRQLYDSRDFHEAEAARVQHYVEYWHDEAAVALRYLDLLDRAFAWRARFQAMPELRPEGPPLLRSSAPQALAVG